MTWRSSRWITRELCWVQYRPAAAEELSTIIPGGDAETGAALDVRDVVLETV